MMCIEQNDSKTGVSEKGAQYFSPRRTCPVCNSGNFDLLHRQSFAEFSVSLLHDGYDVCACRQCGMIFANNIQSQAEFDSYYANFNKYEASSSFSESNSAYDAIVDYIQSRIEKCASIADIGFGNGDLLRKLKEKGYSKLLGIDPSKRNCDLINAFDIDSVCASIFGIKENGIDNQDVIILRAVLEHVVDIKGLCNIVASTVKPEGTVIISVPNVDVLFESEGVKLPFREFSEEHINYFTPNTLSTVMAQFAFFPVWDSSRDDGELLMAFQRKARNDNIYKYVGDSLCAVENGMKKLRGLIASQEEVLVWGTGSLCRYLLSSTEFRNLNIIAYVDSNPHYCGKQLYGKSSISPDNLASYLHANTKIVIAAYKHNEQIINTLTSVIKVQNEIITFLDA